MLVAFERLDRLRRGVDHALEDDQSISRRDDAVVENAEEMAHSELLDFVFNEKLGGLGEGLLNLADADDAATGVQ
jgi:hypothetical protein